MSQVNRGSTFGAFLIGTITCSVVAGGILYFFSDTFRTRADSAYRQMSEWTPENIAEDPINYLNFAEGQTREVLVQLKASEIAIAQKRAKLESMAEEATAKVTAGGKALGQLKSLFRSAEQDGSWPVEWSGQSRERDWVRRQIVMFHTQVKSQEGLADRARAGQEQLQTQLEKIHEARARCEEQVARIETNREILKVDAITSDLTDQLVSMKQVISTTQATTNLTQGDDFMSLGDLVTQSELEVDEAEFDSILNG